MAGRKAKPIAAIEAEGNKSRLTKDEIDRRKEGELKPDSDSIVRPPWLTGEGRKEWERIADELKELGLLTNIDQGSLAICCDAYGKYVAATRQIKNKDLLIEHVNAAGKSNKVSNPIINIAVKYADLYKKYMTEFGLSPSARARLLAPKPGGDEDDGEDDILD
jgi:P27 family predicted phage terminase small subunit